MKRHLWSCIAFVLGLSYAATAAANWTVAINEFCASNDSLAYDSYGDDDDWIELYNYGFDTVDLQGAYITDNLSNPTKFQFTTSIQLPPNSYLLLWADSETYEGDTHLSFNLGASGEEIGLFTPTLDVIDSTSFGPQTTDTSVGRYPNGTGPWYTYENINSDSTPGSPNGPGCDNTLGNPSANHNSGFYVGPLSVVLYQSFTMCEGTSLHYTLDGSEPQVYSPQATSTINLTESTTLRFKMFSTECCPSETITRTYIIDEDFELPVLSLTGQPDDLDELGVFGGSCQVEEVPVRVEYFDEFNGPNEFTLDAGLKIHGDCMGNQRDLRIHARSEYGTSWIDYPIFDQKPITEYKRLILRNGSNDCVGSDCEYRGTMLRDPLMHELYNESNSENGMSASQPVNVYINGEYWGVYNLREKQDQYWMETNFGYEEGEVDFLEFSGSSGVNVSIMGDFTDFYAMKSYVVNNDMSNPTHYSAVQGMIDIDNFVDYQIFEIWAGNQDWLCNNIKFWKADEVGALWRWVMWDTEFGMALYGSQNPGVVDWVQHAFTWGGWGTGDWTYLLRNLVDNDEFREYFITRMADLLNTELAPDRVSDVLATLKDEIDADIQKHFTKWGSSASTWNSATGTLNNFAQVHPDILRADMASNTFLVPGNTYDLTLDTSPANSGGILLNTIDQSWMTDFPWEGVYFTDVPIHIEAVADPGYEFVRWEKNGVAQSWNAEVTVALPADTTLTAVFEIPTAPCCGADQICHTNVTQAVCEGLFSGTWSSNATSCVSGNAYHPCMFGISMIPSGRR